MTYSLTAVDLDDPTLDKIQCKATTQFTRKCGVEMTFPKDIVHAPMSFGGLGIKQICAETYKTKIQTLNCHLHNKITSSTDNILINIHSGRIKPIFESRDRLDYVQDHWFKNIRHFIQQLNGTLKIKTTWKTSLQQAFDNALHVNSLNEWNCINNWRLYLQITTLSDITTFDGKHIRRTYLNKNKMKKFVTRSTMKWPIQHMPELTTFNLWTNHIKQLFTTNSQGKLKTPLTNWIHDPHNKIIIECMRHHLPNHHIAYRINHNTWSIHKFHHELYSTSFYEIRPHEITSNIQLVDYQPIDYHRQKTYFMIKNNNNFQYKHTPTPTIQYNNINILTSIKPFKMVTTTSEYQNYQ
jgi:hypothetical protein